MTRRTYAPTKYIQGKNELQNLYAAIQHLGTAGAYAVVDPYILDNYRQNIEASFTGTPLPLHMNRFEGECSQPEIDRLLADVKRTGADIVLGIGGGQSAGYGQGGCFLRGTARRHYSHRSVHGRALQRPVRALHAGRAV